jgi:hypothetical protein
VPALTPTQGARLHQDFAAQFRAAEQNLEEIWHGLEHRLLQTPYPARPWGHPPLPVAAAMSSAAVIAINDGDKPMF